jgi:hypothetical protein
VNDRESPTISEISATPSVLWPPNHKMVNVYLEYSTSDNCALKNCSVLIHDNGSNSSHPVHDPDWKIIDERHILLRAEFVERLRNRTYSIMIQCEDESGNSNSKTVQVSVAQTIPRVLQNPTRSFFTLDFGYLQHHIVNFRVMDQFGRTVEEKRNLSALTRLAVGHGYKPGVYYIEVTSGKETHIIKAIKL